MTVTVETRRRYALATTHGWIAVTESGGGGLPLLLIHGNSTSSDVFRYQMTGPLALTHHLIAIDLPGHGHSTDAIRPAASYSLAGFADALLEVLEMIGVDKLAIFGWSLGGHIALEMAQQLGANRPESDLKGLMLTGTPPVAAGQMQQGFRASPHLNLASQPHLAPNEVAAFGNAILGGHLTPELFQAISRADGRARQMLFEGARSGLGRDHRQIAESLAVPLAVVNGAEDPLINLDYLERVQYADLWNDRCLRLPRLGHAPFWQAPAIFNPLLRRFMSDLTGGQAMPAQV